MVRGARGAGKDDTMLALRKQLKELGFEEEVIKTVLLQESTGQVTLDQAIDLCLSHNEFQVVGGTPEKSSGASVVSEETVDVPPSRHMSGVPLRPPKSQQTAEVGVIEHHQPLVANRLKQTQNEARVAARAPSLFQSNGILDGCAAYNAASMHAMPVQHGAEGERKGAGMGGAMSRMPYHPPESQFAFAPRREVQMQGIQGGIQGGVEIEGTLMPVHSQMHSQMAGMQHQMLLHNRNLMLRHLQMRHPSHQDMHAAQAAQAAHPIQPIQGVLEQGGRVEEGGRVSGGAGIQAPRAGIQAPQPVPPLLPAAARGGGGGGGAGGVAAQVVGSSGVAAVAAVATRLVAMHPMPPAPGNIHYAAGYRVETHGSDSNSTHLPTASIIQAKHAPPSPHPPPPLSGRERDPPPPGVPSASVKYSGSGDVVGGHGDGWIWREDARHEAAPHQHPPHAAPRQAPPSKGGGGGGHALGGVTVAEGNALEAREQGSEVVERVSESQNGEASAAGEARGMGAGGGGGGGGTGAMAPAVASLFAFHARGRGEGGGQGEGGGSGGGGATGEQPDRIRSGQLHAGGGVVGNRYAQERRYAQEGTYAAIQGSNSNWNGNRLVGPPSANAAPVFAKEPQQQQQQQQQQQLEMGAGEGEVCAVLCGYVGSRYHGLQKHDNGPPTVEEELESALIKAGALVYKDGNGRRLDARALGTSQRGLRSGDLKSVAWTHASRTDKGVHAVGQCIGVSLELERFGATWDVQHKHMLQAIRAALAQQAREKRPPLPEPDVVVYALQKVPKGFYDDRRVDKRVGAGRGVCRFDARRDATGRVYEYQCPSPALVHNADRVALTVEELKAVRITPAEVEAVNRVLGVFIGAHDFHNFTADKCSDEGPTDTVRLVTRFACANTRISPSGIEYMALEVQGDSFIYHQIRKMVGLTIFVLRYVHESSRVAFVKSILADKAQRFIPLAPSVGLMLDRVMFQKENKTHGGHTVLVDLTHIASSMHEFKVRRIYPEIDEREAQHRNLPTPNVQVSTSMEQWLKFLERTRGVWGKKFARPPPSPLHPPRLAGHGPTTRTPATPATPTAPASSDLSLLFGQHGASEWNSSSYSSKSSSAAWEAGVTQLVPVICECLAVCGGKMLLYPDLHEVLMERLRSRRALTRDMRNKLRKSLLALPGGCGGLEVVVSPDGADMIVLHQPAVVAGIAGKTVMVGEGLGGGNSVAHEVGGKSGGKTAGHHALKTPSHQGGGKTAKHPGRATLALATTALATICDAKGKEEKQEKEAAKAKEKEPPKDAATEAAKERSSSRKDSKRAATRTASAAADGGGGGGGRSNG